MSRLPEDLVTMREGCAIVDRGYSTVRAWVKAGQLTGYRKDSTQPNALIYLSRAELLAFMAASGKSMDLPTRAEPAATEEQARLIQTLRTQVSEREAELERLRAELATTRQEREAAQELAGTFKMLAESRERNLRDIDGMVEAERAINVGLRAEVEALRGVVALPWWRRLLG
jgi:hypothetical protein